jgi:hypothetical protein
LYVVLLGKFPVVNDGQGSATPVAGPADGPIRPEGLIDHADVFIGDSIVMRSVAGTTACDGTVAQVLGVLESHLHVVC